MPVDTPMSSETPLELPHLKPTCAMLALRLAIYSSLCLSSAFIYIYLLNKKYSYVAGPESGLFERHEPSLSEKIADLPNGLFVFLLYFLCLILAVKSLCVLRKSKRLAQEYTIPNYRIITFATILFLLPAAWPALIVSWILCLMGYVTVLLVSSCFR